MTASRPSSADTGRPRSPDDLAADLVEALRRTPLPDRDAYSIEELGTLARLHEIFLSAGSEAARKAASPKTWLQLGVHFDHPAQKEAWLSSGDLRRAVESWIARGDVEAFFFMNKPPGLRLRLCVPAGGRDMTAQATSFLDDAAARGTMRGYELGLYDPETRRFGGEAGIDIHHAFATLDSLAILRFRELRASGCALEATTFSLLAATRLVAAVSMDRWEQWEVWCEMRRTRRPPDLATASGVALRRGLDSGRAFLGQILFDRAAVLGGLTEAERDVCAPYEEASAQVAARIAAAVQAGELTCPPRKLIPSFLVFHWNRMGFGLMKQIALSFFMSELLDSSAALPVSTPGTPIENNKQEP